MSALSELLHKLVDLAPFHEQAAAESAHGLVGDVEKELGLAAPEAKPDDPADDEKTPEE